MEGKARINHPAVQQSPLLSPQPLRFYKVFPAAMVLGRAGGEGSGGDGEGMGNGKEEGLGACGLASACVHAKSP